MLHSKKLEREQTRHQRKHKKSVRLAKKEIVRHQVLVTQYNLQNQKFSAAKIISKIDIGTLILVFYYYDMNRNNRVSLGITPGGIKEGLKRQGRYEGRHHIHVEATDNGTILGAFSEDSCLSGTTNKEQLFSILAATFQSLHERLLYDISLYSKRKNPIDGAHVKAIVKPIQKIKGISKELGSFESHTVKNILEASDHITSIYQNCLSKNYDSLRIKTAMQNLDGLNVLQLNVVNEIKIK